MPRVAGNDPYYTFVLKNTRTGKYVHDVEIRLPSVTTIIKSVLAKPQLMPWYFRKGLEAATIALEAAGGPKGGGLLVPDMDSMTPFDLLTDPEVLEDWIKENRLDPDSVTRDAGDRGSEKHEFLEVLAGQALHDPEMAWMTAEKHLLSKDGWERGISDWWITRQPDVLASEKNLFSLRHGFAGSVDLVYNETMTDLKSRKAGSNIYESDHIQVGGYNIAWDEMGETPLSRRTVLLVREDGTWDEEECSFDARKVFLSILDVYTELRKGN